MPWSLDNREGKWCVVKEGGEVEGWHASRADAIKQQRALYANESRVASMYAELDAREPEPLPRVPTPLEEKASELVKIVVGNEQDRALTASVVQAMDGISQRLYTQEQMNESLVAAMMAMADKQPNITVEQPNITVEPPSVTVESPITVQPAEVVLPEINVAAPNVTVHPEILLPAASKTITFERDPLTGQVSKAEVAEG